MLYLENLLIVGGTSKNTGKTTLVCNIINHFSKFNKIIALKVTAFYNKDSDFHGTETLLPFSDFDIFEETNKIQNTDTSRMLKSGADKAFWIRTKEEFLNNSFETFLKNIKNSNYLIVCESNSLRFYVKPAVFIMIKNLIDQNYKPSSVKLMNFADYIIDFNGNNTIFDLNLITIKENSWNLKITDI